MDENLWQLLLVATPSFLLAAGWAVKRVAGYKDSIQKPLLEELDARGETIEELSGELKDREKDLTEERLRRLFLEAKNEALERENNLLREGRGA